MGKGRLITLFCFFVSASGQGTAYSRLYGILHCLAAAMPATFTSQGQQHLESIMLQYTKSPKAAAGACFRLTASGATSLAVQIHACHMMHGTLHGKSTSGVK